LNAVTFSVVLHCAAANAAIESAIGRPSSRTQFAPPTSNRDIALAPGVPSNARNVPPRLAPLASSAHSASAAASPEAGANCGADRNARLPATGNGATSVTRSTPKQ
jgi:hypothetical protein